MRTLIVAPLVLSIARAAWAAGEAACASDAEALRAQAQIDTALRTLADDAAARQHHLEAALRSAGAARAWSRERQAALLRRALSSSRHLALERQKQPHVAEVSGLVMASSGPEPSLSRCAAAERVQGVVAHIVALSRQQQVQALREMGLRPDGPGSSGR